MEILGINIMLLELWLQGGLRTVLFICWYQKSPNGLVLQTLLALPFIAVSNHPEVLSNKLFSE